MPTSFMENIPQILKAIADANPKTVLDIGIGRGKYGFLISEYFPDVQVDGVEVFKDYITKRNKAIYRKIYNENILESQRDGYDLYIIVDVLEHWDKDEGLALIRKFVDGGGKVLISTPRSVGEQGAEFGNEWERHVSQWQGSDFNEFSRKEYFNDLSFMFLLWR